MKRQRPKREPYVVSITGPGMKISATLDKGSSTLSDFVAQLGELLAHRAPAAVPDHYATLGVKPDASMHEIAEAYIRQIVKTLPYDALDRAIKAVAAEIAERNDRKSSAS